MSDNVDKSSAKADYVWNIFSGTSSSQFDFISQSFLKINFDLLVTGTYNDKGSKILADWVNIYLLVLTFLFIVIFVTVIVSLLGQ